MNVAGKTKAKTIRILQASPKCKYILQACLHAFSSFSLCARAESKTKATPNDFSSLQKCFRAASAFPCLLGCLCFVTVCKQIKFKSKKRNRSVFCDQPQSHIKPRACQTHFSLPAGCIWQRLLVVLHAGVHCPRPLTTIDLPLRGKDRGPGCRTHQN